MSKFFKIVFIGISLFSCFTAMATTMEDDYEITPCFLFDDGE